MNQTGVVVVTYNSADVIGRCLDSCAELTIVVIDNASSDATRDIVQQRPFAPDQYRYQPGLCRSR